MIINFTRPAIIAQSFRTTKRNSNKKKAKETKHTDSMLLKLSKDQQSKLVWGLILLMVISLILASNYWS